MPVNGVENIQCCAGLLLYTDIQFSMSMSSSAGTSRQAAGVGFCEQAAGRKFCGHGQEGRPCAETLSAGAIRMRMFMRETVLRLFTRVLSDVLYDLEPLGLFLHHVCARNESLHMQCLLWSKGTREV